MKILIVDDNEKNRKLVRFVLRNSGYETLEAEDCEQGIKLAKETVPDLILMDIQMPVIDGIEAFRILRSEPATKDIPVIALTSYAMSGDRDKLLRAGFKGYISKPINVNEFVSTIKSILDEYKI